MKKTKKPLDDRIFMTSVYIILGIATVVVLYPLYFVVIASFSDPSMVIRGDIILWPKGITLSSYKRIFENMDIWRGYINSIFVTGVGTVLSVVLTICIAYPLSRRYFVLRKPISIILLITMYFQGGMIPTYILVSDLGLRNSLWSLILVAAVSVFNVIVARTFFEANIPQELEEAAEIDGCSKFQFFIYFVPQLSKAIIAVLALYYAMGYWNDYMHGLLYIEKKAKYPLQLVLREILLKTQGMAQDMDNIEGLYESMKMAEALKYGTIIVSIIPPLIIYPFVQKYFVKGVMVGSVKG